MAFSPRKIPCQLFQIGQCLGPCQPGAISRENYTEMLGNLRDFLRGKRSAVEKNFDQKMRAAAAAREFEKAALYRDRLRAIRALGEAGQRAAFGRKINADAVALSRADRLAVAAIFRVREGRVTAREISRLGLPPGENPPPGEILSRILGEFYGSGTPPPGEILVENLPPDAEFFAAALGKFAGKKVAIRRPVRGDGAKILALARDSAAGALRDAAAMSSGERAAVGLAALAELLGKIPGGGKFFAGGNLEKKSPDEKSPADPETLARIECFDISHLGGRETVASMSVLDRGLPAPKFYRRFLVRGLARGEIDDFKAMAEVVARRLAHPEWGRPDLIVLDGGAPQFSAVAKKIAKIPAARGLRIVALAKGEDRGARTEFLFFGPGARDFVKIEPGDPARGPLDAVRDEAHRFAITHQRKRRKIAR